MIGSPPSSPSTSRVPPGAQVTYGTGMTTSSTASTTNTIAATRAVTVCRVIRPRRSRLAVRRQPDPFGAAVDERLLLPDRHLGLDGVDQRAARVQRGPAVHGARGDDHGEVADLEVPAAVRDGDGEHVVGRSD